MNFYNDIDPKACAWLKELIAQGLIPNGVVDSRSIADIQPHELDPFTQCHFFAGIAGWPLALQWAGWPDDLPVWTGSCPCQPFSTAGHQLGTADERHLWPAFFNLIRQRNPPVVLGEQVASPAALLWLDGVFADLESQDYACAAADLCAAGLGAPHIRQRLFWVGHSNRNRSQPRQQTSTPTGHGSSAFPDGIPGRLANLPVSRPQERENLQGTDQCQATLGSSPPGGLVHPSRPQKEGLRQQRKHLPGQTAWSTFNTLHCID